MKKLITLLLLATLFVSCNDPKNYKYKGRRLSEIPDKDLASLKEGLTENEKLLLARYTFRTAFGGKHTAETIGESIELQREFEANAAIRREAELQEQKEEQAKKAAALSEMRRKFHVEVLSKSTHKEDYQEYNVLEVKFNNLSGKDIRAVQYTLIVNDLFGDHITNLTVKESNTLKVKHYRKRKYFFNHNQYINKDTRLRGATHANLRFDWIIDKVIYADGSSDEYSK